ncbi:ammonia-dependent NAD(+) synthetase [Paenibacillus antri]|uniref:NH(3)-dependent NAD(+) synthetase n=1 Tax=Paenibacillus antri TaxID=2582848 RepID=A0A5R9G147_9BACL|nr:ammonia-dependent NAD(+) synthetase [Paenibacillus antri]TLS50057.1 ammonia-dependent NAD(+) synthetase [Paenibacillus antri]
MQRRVMAELKTKESIDPSREIRERIDFLKAYCRRANGRGFVLGISGGQDSTLAGRLAQLAASELREEGYDATFTAVRLPYGEQKDEADAQAALAFIEPDRTIVLNIAESVDAFVRTYRQAAGGDISDFQKGNVKARVRMLAQYAIAGEHGCLVIGTDHAAEAVTGFFTKFGDGGADLLPLSGLTKRQGRELLIRLHAPERLYLKTPTADLLDAKPLQADETELGIAYGVLDDYLEGKPVDGEARTAIEKRYAATQHKRELPVTMYDSWWK